MTVAEQLGISDFLVLMALRTYSNHPHRRADWLDYELYGPSVHDLAALIVPDELREVEVTRNCHCADRGPHTHVTRKKQYLTPERASYAIQHVLRRLRLAGLVEKEGDWSRYSLTPAGEALLDDAIERAEEYVREAAA